MPFSVYSSNINYEIYITNIKQKIEKCIFSFAQCILKMHKCSKQDGLSYLGLKEVTILYTYRIDHLQSFKSTPKNCNYIFADINSSKHLFSYIQRRRRMKKKEFQT